jgi:uncharacterized surface protein with fasciclin (FAS1) repeats
MKTRHLRTGAALAATALAAAALVPGPAAQAHSAPLGTTSLAQVLAADGLAFDNSWGDFDILDQAVNDVLGAKPDSAVAALADGQVRLTAFAPTDRSFRRLVAQLTGTAPADEPSTYAALSSFPVDTVESVLLYHVVPGAPITYRQAKEADGAKLTTALGTKLDVNYHPATGVVRLVDKDPDAANAKIYPARKNLNQGNRQIAHGISQVLRPIDL